MLSSVKIREEECKVCHLRRKKEFPETESTGVVVSDVGGDIKYYPYRDVNLPSYDVIKYLEENKVKLEPNIRYKVVNVGGENLVIPEDVDASSLEVEGIKEIPEDINAYSYDKRKFIHVVEEEKPYKIGDDEYVDVVRYYIDGGEKHVVSVETYRIIYVYEPTFYSSIEDDNPEDYAKDWDLVKREVFEGVVKVNAFYLNLHRRKAMAFKALYRALTKAGYKVTITRDGDDKIVRVEKGKEYGETAKYAEFPMGYYTVLAENIYDLTF
jgi:hypothetical protein